jgi:hypothetical protein
MDKWPRCGTWGCSRQATARQSFRSSPPLIRAPFSCHIALGPSHNHSPKIPRTLIVSWLSVGNESS